MKKAAEINEHISYHDITPGGQVYEGGTAAITNTGDWRTMVPAFIPDKCKHCMLCVPVCPDSIL